MSRLSVFLLLLAALSGHSLPGAAQSTFKPPFGASWPVQDAPTAEEYKLTEEDFQQHYAANDTAAAIIHLYFTKRNKGLLLNQIFGTAGVAVSTVDRVQQQQQAPYGQTATAERAAWVMPALLATVPVAIGGLIYAANWSRIDCYRMLRRYKALGMRELTPAVRRHLPKSLGQVHDGKVSW